MCVCVCVCVCILTMNKQWPVFHKRFLQIKKKD